MLRAAPQPRYNKMIHPDTFPPTLCLCRSAFPSLQFLRGEMKGDHKVIAFLNEVLKAELTAINQYFLHSEMCENWGYERMAKLVKKESIEEMVHAEKLMERILYLDGTPNMTDYFKINIGATVEAQIKNDLQLEYDAVKRLNDGIKLCLSLNDAGSRELAEKILSDEEHHIDWLEAQLHAISEMGIQNYLAQQLKEED
jgi:bacterioferritin